MLSQIINFIKKAARKKNQPHSMSRSNFTKGGKVGANLNAINVRRVRSSLMFYQKEKKPLLITNKRTPFFQCSLRWLLEGFQSVVLVIFQELELEPTIISWSGCIGVVWSFQNDMRHNPFKQRNLTRCGLIRTRCTTT